MNPMWLMLVPILMFAVLIPHAILDELTARKRHQHQLQYDKWLKATRSWIAELEISSQIQDEADRQASYEGKMICEVDHD